ncbi:recombinase RecT [Joostella sp.]|uniref:recombinase RecT n=1 Tax=Joostella sp. TaxID=2231138 RepID=UPI003A911687
MSTQTKNTQVAEIKKDISAQVLSKIEGFQQTGELSLPKDYSPENALKSAYLILSETENKQKQKALDHCTKESIANALLKMVVWGLSPLKKQCDFIMYGNKLDCSIEYTGNIALAKRYGGLKEIKAHAIFEGDEFEFENDVTTGCKKVTLHKQTLQSLGSGKVIGAYAIMHMVDGSIDTEIMNIKQIEAAWNQGAMNGNSPAHKNFPDQMAKKTVINRACKLLIRGSNDSVLYTENEGERIDTTSADVAYEVSQKANKKEIGFDDVEDAEVVHEEVASEPQKEVVEQDGPGF